MQWFSHYPQNQPKKASLQCSTSLLISFFLLTFPVSFTSKCQSWRWIKFFPLDFFTCRKISGKINTPPLHGSTKVDAALRNPRVTTQVFRNVMATRLLAWKCKAMKFKIKFFVFAFLVNMLDVMIVSHSFEVIFLDEQNFSQLNVKTGFLRFAL